MYYRKSGRVPGSTGGANQRALKSLVDTGEVPGLIGYVDGEPVGWISLGPREDYAKLQRSPVMKAVDDKPVWSIICFFVDPRARDKGIANKMLKSAIAYARSRGATLLEAYPVDTSKKSGSLWFGTKSMYDREGFKEVARRKVARSVMRKALRKGG